MIQDFHRRGVSVLFPLWLWDQGTRDPRLPDAVAAAKRWPKSAPTESMAIRFDGIPRSFRTASDTADTRWRSNPRGLPAFEALTWNNLGLGILEISRCANVQPHSSGWSPGTW